MQFRVFWLHHFLGICGYSIFCISAQEGRSEFISKLQNVPDSHIYIHANYEATLYALNVHFPKNGFLPRLIAGCKETPKNLENDLLY